MRSVFVECASLGVERGFLLLIPRKRGVKLFLKQAAFYSRLSDFRILQPGSASQIEAINHSSLSEFDVVRFSVRNVGCQPIRGFIAEARVVRKRTVGVANSCENSIQIGAIGVRSIGIPAPTENNAHFFREGAVDQRENASVRRI